MNDTKFDTVLWLDDIRDPRTFPWLNNHYIRYADTVVWVKTFDQFVEYIKAHGFPSVISFDHDLADPKHDGSGYACAKWLVEYCQDHDLDLPEYGVHSANPVGAENIHTLLHSYTRHQSNK